MSSKATVEWVIDAIDQYAEAKRDHAKARENYNGYSWGYHGEHYTDAVEAAAVELTTRLNDYVDERVRETIQKMKAEGLL